jgi:hypothetical protein
VTIVLLGGESVVSDQRRRITAEKEKGVEYRYLRQDSVIIEMIPVIAGLFCDD